MKKTLIFTALGLGLLVLLAGCAGSGDEPYRDEIVVQGFMVSGERLALRLTRTVPMGEYYDTTAIGVAGATVTITSGTDTFALVEQPNTGRGAGFYAVADSAAIAIPGRSYALRAEVEGRVIRAEMTATGAVQFTSAGPDTVEYGDMERFFTVRWSRDSLAAGYVILIENLEPDWFEDYRKVSGNNGPDMVNWNVWIAYPHEDSVRVGWVFLGYTGRHRVRVISCNRDAWNYFWTYLPANVDYNPISNVSGGLGLFAAGGVDTTYFYLKDEINDGPPAE